MALTKNDYRILAMLRNIPEAALLAIVAHPGYANAIAMTSAPIPDSVFDYIATTYREDKRGLLFARHLSPAQRDYVLNLRVLNRHADSFVLNGFFNHNTLTPEELSRVKKYQLTETGAIDLLRHHRTDSAAIATIIKVIPKGLASRVANTRLPAHKVTPAMLMDAMYNDIVTPVETPTDLHPPYPVTQSVDYTWAARVSTGNGATYTAAVLTELLGTSPSSWLAFLSMLNRAGDAPVATVVATLLRSRRQTEAPALT